VLSAAIFLAFTRRNRRAGIGPFQALAASFEPRMRTGPFRRPQLVAHLGERLVILHQEQLAAQPEQQAAERLRRHALFGISPEQPIRVAGREECCVIDAIVGSSQVRYTLSHRSQE
jgi:hypothetical protein